MGCSRNTFEARSLVVVAHSLDEVARSGVRGNSDEIYPSIREAILESVNTGFLQEGRNKSYREKRIQTFMVRGQSTKPSV